jgi:hypothetical protein
LFDARLLEVGVPLTHDLVRAWVTAREIEDQSVEQYQRCLFEQRSPELSTGGCRYRDDDVGDLRKRAVLARRDRKDMGARVGRTSLPEAEAKDLHASGVCAETCSLLVDSDGNRVKGVDERRMGITEDALRAIPTVIAVTTGPRRIAATRAVLRSGLVSSLVTDVEVAAALLNYNQSAPASFVGAPARQLSPYHLRGSRARRSAVASIRQITTRCYAAKRCCAQEILISRWPRPGRRPAGRIEA